MYRIINEDPVPMGKIRPEIPEVLVKITMKALAKDPLKRYLTCMDFAYDLKVALRGLKGTTTPKAKVEDIIDYVHQIPFFVSFTKRDSRRDSECKQYYQGDQRGDSCHRRRDR